MAKKQKNFIANRFTPRNLRKGGGNSKNGPEDKTKSKLLRKRALVSKRFIFLSSDQLEKPKVAPHYAKWCKDCDSLQRGGK